MHWPGNLTFQLVKSKKKKKKQATWLFEPWSRQLVT